MDPCPNCGMTKDQWKGNDGQGVDRGGQPYCCDGCADQGAGACTCR